VPPLLAKATAVPECVFIASMLYVFEFMKRASTEAFRVMILPDIERVTLIRPCKDCRLWYGPMFFGKKAEGGKAEGVKG